MTVTAPDLWDAPPETYQRTLISSVFGLDRSTALFMKMRMSALRHMKCAMRPEHCRFIASTCHVDPDVLTGQQLAHINRLAWRYRYHLPAVARPTRDPDSEFAS